MLLFENPIKFTNTPVYLLLKFADQGCAGIWKSPNEISDWGDGGWNELSKIDDLGWNGGCAGGGINGMGPGGSDDGEGGGNILLLLLFLMLFLLFG